MLAKIVGHSGSKPKTRYIDIYKIESITEVAGKVDEEYPFGVVIHIETVDGHSTYEDWYWYTSEEKRDNQIDEILNLRNN